jgi:hypothetical protein
MENPDALKRARIRAIVLGSAVITCLIFLLYAFVQKQEANKARIEAMNQRMGAERNAFMMKLQIAECEKVNAKKDSIIAGLEAKGK